MRKLFVLLLAFWLMLPGGVAFADTTVVGGGSGSGVQTASDCDTASFYTIGVLCQDLEDAKLYKGTGAAIAEITAGSPGDVASDGIWDVKGDTAVGTGANTAGRLPIGTAFQIYHVNTDTPGWTSTLGATGTRLTAGFFTDLTVTNAIAGSVTGNAATATALAADPANCEAGKIALGVNASGVAECTATPTGLTSVAATTFTGALTGNASTATKLAADPADCTNQFARGIADTGAAACASVAAADITNNTITAAQLAATLTFADGDLIDLSGITHTGAADEGLILPNWANVTPTSDKKFLAVDGSNLKLYNGGWVTIGSTGAPTDATYLTVSLDGTLSGERTLAEGLAIDFTDAGANGAFTIAFDPTELTGDRTWAAGGAAAVTWTWNNSGTDPSLTFGNDLISTANSFTIATGKNLTVGSTKWNSGDEIDGTMIKDADYGDITVSAAGVWAVEDDSHAHGSTTITLASTNLSDTSALAYLAGAQTFTANNVFGNADTDTLTLRSLLVGGNSRAVWIAGSAPTPTYATGTNELYVAGDIETAGTVYAASFNGGTGTDGSRELVMTTNTGANIPTATGNKLYFIDNVLKVVEDGTAKDVPLPGDSVTWTGTSHSFAGVTNMVLPTATPDAAGEIGILTTAHQLVFHAGGASADNAVQNFDFDSCATGQVMKTNGSGVWACADDATAGSPTLNSIGAPTADSAIEFNAGEEVAWNFTGNYTTGSQFLVEQKTGNPSGGVLFEVKSADADTTNARFGDGTNYVNITTAGVVSFAGTTAAFNATSAASSIPWPVGAGTAANTAEGSAYWESDTDMLTIGDGATGISLNFTAGQAYLFPTTSATLARTDAGQTFTGVQAFTAPTVATSIAPASADGATLGTAAAEFSDLYLAAGGVIYGENAQENALTSSATGWFTNLGFKVGPAAPDDVQPTFAIRGDADSDAAGDTTEAFTITLTPNATPTLATWEFTSTQSAGYTFDKPVQAPAKFVGFTGAATLTAAAHNGAIVMMTTADEVTMWDCTSSTIGHFVVLWARDAEKIEVVPASGDQFYLFDGTGIGANDELDMAATAGTKVTLMCTAADEWRVVFETAACADGGAAD